MTQPEPVMPVCLLQEGQIKMHCGYEFVVSRIRYVGKDALDQDVWNFMGTCTDAPVNDQIRHTSYNGGTFSWRNSDK